VRVRERKKGEVHWACSNPKNRCASGQEAATDGRRRAWRLGRAAAQRVRARKSQRGRLSGGRASWRPGGVGKTAKGQLAAGENTGDGRWTVLQRNREGEAGGRRPGPVHKFCKSSRSLL
jgi:hypothetical protein